MPRLDSTLTTFVVSILLAAGIVFLIQQLEPGGGTANGAASGGASQAVGSGSNATTGSGTDGGKAATANAGTRWAATAPGKVEPRGGEIALVPEVGGKVIAVYAGAGDAVKAGDLIVQLKDEELRARRAAALNEVKVRTRERDDDKPARNTKERIDAEDAVFTAERDLFKAREDFDTALIEMHGGSGSSEAVDIARLQLEAAELRVKSRRKELDDILDKEDTPLPNRLQGGLEAARDDLRILEIEIERRKLRAPSDGMIFDIDARAGEVISPAATSPVIRFGDNTALTVRAEVAERDLSAIKIGQSVVIQSPAFSGQDFEGTVAAIAPTLSRPEIGGRGPRQQSDVDVVEVTIDLKGETPLLSGLRVDVFFRHRETAENKPQTN